MTASLNINSFIGSKIEKYYFNSVNHFIENAAVYTGKSITTIRKELQQINYTFKNNQIKFSNYIICDIKPLPNYILQTQQLKDTNLHLSQKDYDILLYLDVLKKCIDKSQEEYKELHRGFSNWLPFLYPRIKTITKGTGYTYDQVKHSLHKLCNYFKNFYRKMSPVEWANKKYLRAKTKTIDLPKRSEWKKIIESKVREEMIEVTDFRLPKLITKKEYEIWQKQVKREKESSQIPITLVRFQEILTRKTLQAELLQKGKELWQKQKENLRILVNETFDEEIEIEEVNEIQKSKKCISDDIGAFDYLIQDQIDDEGFMNLFNWKT